MRINFCEISEKKYTCDDIMAGDLFITGIPTNEDAWPEINIYLKLSEEIITEDDENVNCVNIINGSLCYVEPTARVYLYKSKVNFDTRKFEG